MSLSAAKRIAFAFFKRPFSVPDRPYNDRRYFIDTTKVTTEIGWQCEISFEEGLRRTVAYYISTPEDTYTEHLLIYGGNGWIGDQFCAFLKTQSIAFEMASTRPGEDDDEVIRKEIIRHAPSHVVSLLGRTHGPGCNTIDFLEGGADKLTLNIRDNLYAPWLLAHLCNDMGIHFTYLGTGCIFSGYDKAYTEDDRPNYFGNAYSVAKGFTDRIMRQYELNVLNVRIRLPVNFADDARNLVVKVSRVYTGL